MNLRTRSSGVLLHVTSLPSSFGIGDFGPSAFKFCDLLSNIKQSSWQILPLTTTTADLGNSPYVGTSAFAGNTLLISPERLAQEKLIPQPSGSGFDLPRNRVDYEGVSEIKDAMMKKAYETFLKRREYYDHEFEDYCSRNSFWLDDYTLYRALRQEFGRPWHLWPRDLRDRDAGSLDEKRNRLHHLIGLERFAQFIFFRQWHDLKDSCRRKDIHIVGDLPFYVGHDSADVWAHQEIFKLDADKRPTYVSGVPPDYFSDNGQLWGHPVYDWETLEATGFEWWINRIKHNLELHDALRIDHFRGLLAYWEVPAHSKTAVDGKWIRTPSERYFHALVREFPELPFIAEDLGVITPDVRELINRLDIPGMNVLLFAFGSANSPYLPHNHSQNSVVYTGTHDTQTARGWFKEESTREEKDRLFRYLGRSVSEEEVSWELIRLAMMSVSNLCIIPIQDMLSLGSEARMNDPGGSSDNWQWRVTSQQLISDPLSRFGETTETFARC